MSFVLPPNKIGTGDSALGNLVRFSFTAPSDTWIVQAIFGFFIEYTFASTWYQVGTATVDETIEVFEQIYNSLGVDLATIGAIVPYAGGILPVGWLPCDGRSLVRADYPDLFGAIGTVWGAVDSAHFNIPDLRNRTLVGQGDLYALGQYGGEKDHTLTTAEMPSHTHTDTGHSHTEGTAVPSVVTPGELPVPVPAATPSVGVTGTGFASLTNTGGGAAHNNMPPFAGVNYAIIAQ